jgi:tetratricopeptide (TPR) repeat protein
MFRKTTIEKERATMAKIKKKSSKSRATSEVEFRSIAQSVADTYKAYRNQFNTALAVVALVLIAAISYSYLSANKEAKASQLLDAAYQAAGQGGSAPPNYAIALQRFQDAADQYGGTLSGAVAAFEIGNTLAEMGQYEQAVKQYEKCVKEYAKDRFLLQMVYQRLGYAYLDLGKRNEAQDAFVKAEATGGPGPATIELARLYDNEGKTAEATKMYKEVSEKLSSTSWAVEARTKLPPPVLQTPMTAPAGTAEK